MSKPEFKDAERNLREDFHWNPWFLATYWPENAPRMAEMSRLVAKRFPRPEGIRLLEVGCANGYAAALFRMLGYEVTATDAYDDGERTKLFEKHRITYLPTNLNNPETLTEFDSGSFDVVLLGEVFEHILNHPLGLLQSIRRLLKPGGQLILTTPNPDTLANSIRMLRGDFVLWGTAEFMRQMKFDGAKIIDYGAIHYREYPLRLTSELMVEAGFRVGESFYVSPGIAPSQPRLKRWVKMAMNRSGMDRKRLFSPGYLIEGFRPNA